MTLGYLGPATHETDLAMRIIPYIVRHLRIFEPENIVSHVELIGFGTENPFWSSLWKVLTRPWFGGVWVVQEAILAKELQLGCGLKWLNVNTFIELMDLIQAKGLDLHLQISGNIFDHMMYAYELLRLRADSKNMAAEDDRIFVHLATSRDSLCTSPSDHVLGMLGLLRPYHLESFQEWYDRLYLHQKREKNKEGVVNTAMGCWMIDEFQDLQLLSHVSINGRGSSAPSWCPQWEVTQTPGYLLGVSNYMAGIALPRSTISNTKNMLKLSEDGEKLELMGFKVDQIFDFHRAYRKTKSNHFTSLEDSQWILEWMEECSLFAKGNPGLSSNDIPQSYWKALTGDNITRSQQTHEMGNGKWQYLLFKTALEQVGKAGQGQRHNLSPIVAKQAENFADDLDSIGPGRTFIKTTGGRFGWAPEDARQGDIICVFYGGGPLYLIRPEPDGMGANFIGECFMQGLMREREAFNSPDGGLMKFSY